MNPVILLAGGGTGGHVFPLIAVAEALRVVAPELSPVFVGTARGMETRVVPRHGYELELMEVLPLRGGGVAGALRGGARALGAVAEARQLLGRRAPRAVLSIGGYAAGPITLAARLAGIPIGLLEPNAVMGLANRLLAPLVARAYLAFPEPERHFRASVVRRHGVPLRSGFQARPLPALEPSAPRRVLVLGGSQGAKALNELVPRALAASGLAVTVTHQCGADHQRAVEGYYRELGLERHARVVPFIEDMVGALDGAELVVGRAGASAVSELCAVGRGSLLVPYPFAAGDHQAHNARSLERRGAAVCVESAEASVERLTTTLQELLGDVERLRAMADAARGLGRPDAAARVAADLLQLAGLSPVEAPAPRLAAEVG